MQIKKILSIPRSLIYNVIFFGWKGLRLPLLFSNETVVRVKRRNSIHISNFTKRVAFGFGGSKGIAPFGKSYFLIGDEGVIYFNGEAHFGAGSSIRIDKGEMHIGDNFWCNKNCTFISNTKIMIGNQALLGWNVNIRDMDGHDILQEDKILNNDAPVNIGEKVWIGSYVDILKGIKIPDNCVVGIRSIVTKNYNFERNCVIAGSPAKVIKKNIDWKK